MRFSFDEMRDIERTMERLYSVAGTVWARDSTDGANARCLMYIISEMRQCAKLIESDERSVRVAGYDRLDNLLNAKG